MLLNHCAVSNPTDCHEHFVRSFTGISSGSIIAPDHEYPAFLRLVLTATKPVNGAAMPIAASASQVVLPAITTLTFTSSPSGLQLAVYGAVGTTPFSRTLIEGAQTTVSAASPQLWQGAPYAFAGWSDGGGQTHLITAPASPATLTATFTPAASGPVVWNSWEVATQGGTPQGLVSAVGGGTAAAVEFYESTNNGGVTKGALFGAYVAGVHPEDSVEGYWWPGGAGDAYPHAGKSTVGRGADVGETNVVGPTGVRDLQLHPPNNLHYTVAAFRAPLAGTYAISGVGVRRVSNLGGTVRLRVLDAQATVLANIQATTTRAWTWAGTTYTVPNVAAGAYLYFAVDRDGADDYDATEIAWTITAGAGPAAPSCTLNAVPSTVSQGGMTTLSWTSANATSLSIDQGVGLVATAGGIGRRVPGDDHDLHRDGDGQWRHGDVRGHRHGDRAAAPADVRARGDAGVDSGWERRDVGVDDEQRDVAGGESRGGQRDARGRGHALGHARDDHDVHRDGDGQWRHGDV